MQTNMNSTVNLDLCSKCRLCIEVCPCNIIGLNENENVHFIQERETICLHCGQCMGICSTKAISVDGLSYEGDFIDLPEINIDYNTE